MLLVHRLLPVGRARKAFLLGASYFFYGCWDPRFLALIAASTLVDFVAGRKIHESESTSSRKNWLRLSLGANLGMLAFFKYFNFFVDTLAHSLQAAGVPFETGTLNIILPVGISFYTFQTLSYSIDIYRGKLQPTASLLDFALFVGFFPQLVAGPIVRAAEFLPQLGRTRPRNSEEFFEGLERFLVGLFKKLLIADIAAAVVDPVFAGEAAFSGPVCAAAVLAFTIQIYFDFSGYSDMAIGLAAMLGFRLPVNFRLPYLSSSMTDFWRRWHISLSAWFRDYLYIPLGGNRGSRARTLFNLVITFLLTGLWHGAAWTFVIFGAWNGLWLLVERAWNGRGAGAAAEGLLLRTAGRLYTLVAVILAFTVFRSQSLAQCANVLRRIVLNLDGDDAWFSPLRFGYVVGAAFVYHALTAADMRRKAATALDPWLWRPFFYTLIVVLLLSFAPLTERAFIYFAF